MGGGGSKKRAEEEERKAAAAKEREIMESMEERLAFIRAEEEREAAAAKRREIMEKKLKEECSALIRAEEKREAAAAKEREIMEKKSKEEHLAFLWELLSVSVPTSIISSRRRAGSPAPSCLSLKSDWSIDSPPLFSDEPGPPDTKDPVINAATDLDSIFSLLRENIVDYVDDKLNKFIRFLTNDPEGLESQGECEEGLNVKEEAQRRESTEGFLKITLDFLRMNQEELADSKQRLSSLEPRPIIPRAEEETEDPPLRREIRELVSMGESIALIWQRLSSLEPRPIILRYEEEREAAALRREIMELPSMEERLALRQEHLSSLEPDPNIISPSDLGEGVIPEEEEAVSPAPSCESMKSDRSMD